MEQIFLNFHICYYTEEGDLVDDFFTIERHYLKLPSGFLRDILSVLPIELLALLAPPNSQFLYLSTLRVLRLLRALNILEYFHQWEQELEIK